MTKISKYHNLLKKSIHIANDFGFIITIEEVIDHYSETHRYWHVLQHLYDLLEGIDELYSDKKIDEREYNILLIAAIFHDIIYDTKKSDNEEKSIDFMMSRYDENKIDETQFPSTWRNSDDLKKIQEVIINTKTHDSKDGLCKKFNKLDTWILDAQFINMLDWENKIYNEYKWVGWKTYKKKRIEFLLKSIKDHTHNVINIKNLIDYIRNKSPKIGIFYYETDKLSLVEEYKQNIEKLNNLFDIIIILMVLNDICPKDKIKEYGINSDNNEFIILKEEYVSDFLTRQKGNINVVKELKYIKEYNKNIQRFINNKFKIIYI